MVELKENDQLAQQTEQFHKLIEQLIRGLHASNPPEFIELELSPGQFIAGMVIQQHGTCTMSEIANALGVSLSAITGIIDRMVKHGFVERMRDDSDRRLVRVKLTEKGNSILNEDHQHKNQHLRSILGVLNETDRASLIDLIQKIIDALHQQKNTIKG
jgi:MarR family transcriptional regulator, organic hydroperoxide resistance regulator